MELTSAHMVSNLIENVKVALKRYKVKSITGSTGSKVVMHWLNKQGLYKQFVADRVTTLLE